MQSRPLIKFSHEIDIYSTPEEIFPYLVEPEKIMVVHAFEYAGLVSVKAQIEYKGQPGVGTEFIKHIVSNPIQGASEQAKKKLVIKEKMSYVINGSIVRYEPPFLLELESSPDSKSLFQTVTRDRYTLMNIKHGTSLRLDSEVFLRHEEAEYIANIVVRLFSLFIFRIAYIPYLIYKKIVTMLFHGQLKKAMDIPLKNLKQIVEQLHTTAS